MIRISSATTASTMRRVPAGTRSTKKATPAFSPRATALAAPKKLDPTIRPRATSADHSTGALNSERSVTVTMTTARSAASSTAATASVMPSRTRTGTQAPAVAGALVTVVSGLGRLDLLDEGLRLRPLLDEVLRLHGDALAERVLVAVVDRDALLLQHLLRLAFHRHAVRARVGRGLLRRIDESLAHLGVHALQCRLAEIDRERREVVLGQRIELGGLVELAGDDRRRVVLQPVEHAGLQRGVDLAERERRRGRAHQAQAFGDDRVRQGADLQARQILRRLDRLLGEHAARPEIVGPGDDADVRALEQRVLDRPGGARVERLGLLRERIEQVTEVERAHERHEVRRDRRAGDHHVDDAELHRVDDVDLLAEL